MWGELSPRAQKCVDEARARRVSWQMWAEAGPRLYEGTIYVPSPYFIEEARQFWKAQGFTFEQAEYGHQSEWTRDTRRPLRGKRYTPEAWLKAARRRYFEFYPEYVSDSRSDGGDSRSSQEEEGFDGETTDA